ncbi:MAG: DUF6036 family nucleotidyltransferase [Candidatus Geothermarchaeales archaeon]
MISYDELLSYLNLAATPTERMVHFAALLGKAAKITPDDLILVGGSAVQFYTVGEYTSGDIDIVSSSRHRLEGVLKKWRFSKPSRIWLNEEIEMVVDIRPSPYTGDISRTELVSTPYGEVRVASLEDLVVSRLVSTKHWKIPGDFDHARLLSVQEGHRMDWDYIERRAREEFVEDLLKVLRESVAEPDA